MRAWITLYKNCYVDSENSKYLMAASGQELFVNYFSSFLFAQYDSSTFKVQNGEFVDLALPAVDGLEEVTYICITVNKTDSDDYLTPIRKYYHVLDFEMKPQGIRYHIAIDLWATWISSATLSDVIITRTNMSKLDFSVGNAWHPEFFTQLDVAPEYTGTSVYQDVEIDSLKIAFGSGNNALEEFAFIAKINVNRTDDDGRTYSFSAYAKMNPDLVSVGKNKVDFQNAARQIFGIYQCNQFSEWWSSAAAEVTELYVIPSAIFYKIYNSEDMVGALAYTTVYFKRIYNETGSQWGWDTYTSSSVGGILFAGGEYVQPIYLSNIAPATGVEFWGKQSSAGYDVFNYDNPQPGQSIGVKGYMLDLPPFVGCVGVEIVWKITSGEFKILMRQGNNETDITNAFKIDGTANTGSLTASQATAKNLADIASVIGGAAQIATVATGNIAGGVSGAATIAGTISSRGAEARNGTYVPGGDAFSTYQDIFDNDGGYLLKIRIPNTQKTGDSTAKKEYIKRYIAQYGASCYIPFYPKNSAYGSYDMKVALRDNAPYVEEGTEGLGYTYARVFACECTVTGVPYDAAKYIQETLRKGIRYVCPEVIPD